MSSLGRHDDAKWVAERWCDCKVRVSFGPETNEPQCREDLEPHGEVEGGPDRPSGRGDAHAESRQRMESPR